MFGLYPHGIQKELASSYAHTLSVAYNDALLRGCIPPTARQHCKSGQHNNILDRVSKTADNQIIHLHIWWKIGKGAYKQHTNYVLFADSRLMQIAQGRGKIIEAANQRGRGSSVGSRLVEEHTSLQQDHIICSVHIFCTIWCTSSIVGA